MAKRWANLPAAGSLGLCTPILIGLLTARFALPDSEWSRLQGSEAIGEELRDAGTQGYYEGLLDVQAGPPPASGAEGAPPPGSAVFAESGLIEEVDGYLRWRLRPGLDTAWNGNPFRTNRLGYRSPEIRAEKPAGTYRVVVVGSSNTMGHGVGDEAVYVRLLERWLTERIGPGGPRIEVVNLAVSADDPARRLMRLANEVPLLDPDWVICDATVMDVSLAEAQLSWALRSRVALPFPYLDAAMSKAGALATDPPEALGRKLRAAYRDILEGAFAGWAGESSRQGVPISVVVLPRADGRSKAENVRAFLLDLARRHGLDAIDLTDAFDGLTIDEYRVSARDKHPNVLGHRRIFEALRDELEGRGRLPGLNLPK